MINALYGAAIYGNAEYGVRESMTYTATITETVASSYLASAISLFRVVTSDSVAAASALSNVLVFTTTPALRTFLVPVEKRNLS